MEILRMSDKGWIRPPIWREVAEFLQTDIQAEGHECALAFYDLAERLFGDAPKFVSALSPSQYNSMRLIQDWWASSIEEDEWFATNTDKLKALRILDIYPALDYPPMIVQMVLGLGPVVPKVSTYRLELFRLFQMEFDPRDGQGQDVIAFHGYLQQQRERSAFYASIQRITYSFTKEQTATEHLSRPLLDAVLDTRPLGATIEPCPWLNFKRDRKGHPFYLWDVDHKCTIVVDELEQIPAYICISHTWGRWQADEPFVTVPNVPWLVPPNTRFRVNVLPETLAAAFPGKHLWIDLFCIPQDRSERALLEIARQAEIFGNATAVVAWLNEITDWTGLRKTVEWLSLYGLQNRGDTNENLPLANVASPTGLILDDDKLDSDYLKTPGSWFTSLWTLQEACLRPDMALCNRSFELLTVGDGTIVTLDTLAALFNFVIGLYSQSPFETVLNRTKASETLEAGTVVEFGEVNLPGSLRRRRVLQKLPENATGVVELHDALIASGMNKLSTISPPAVFNLGQRRECTSNRAEAIMSIVGATNWYHSHIMKHKEAPSEREMVLNSYPAAFLNEAAQLTGARFFASVASDLANLNGVVDIEEGAWIPTETSTAIGSLLPFTLGHTTLLTPEHDNLDTEDHPSTLTWTVLPDGKVNLTLVGLLSSTDNAYGRPELPASVLVPGIFTTTPGGEINLHDWTRTFRVAPSAYNHAVCVYQQSRKVLWGVLLKEIGAAKRLVKVGTFFTGAVHVRDIPSRDVDWIVL
jgi:hypothetical protein